MKAQNTKTYIQHKHHKLDSNSTTISKTKFVMANCSKMHPHTTTRWKQEKVTYSTYVPLQAVTHRNCKLCRSFGQMPLPSNEIDNGHMPYFNR
jgi:hypothetical protein